MSSGESFIIFSLHSYILAFAVQETMVGDTLKDAGFTPLLLWPSQCTCKLPSSLASWHPQTKLACRTCQANHRGWRATTPGWEHRFLPEYSRDTDLKTVENLMAQLSVPAVKELKLEGIEIGKVALHDVLLKYKRDDLDFDPVSDVWAEYCEIIRASAYAVIWMKRLFETQRPRGFIVYNSNYSVNRAVCMLAESLQIPWFSMHGGASLRYRWDQLEITKGSIDQHRNSCGTQWARKYSDRILVRDEVQKVADHFHELFTGKQAHAYSAPTGTTPCEFLLEKVNPSGSRKVLLAATSSTDERFAVEHSGIRPLHPAESYLFPSQLDWIKFLIEKVSASPDLALIIRVHPREFPNKRESVHSSNAQRLKSLLVDLPNNVIVNWPEDQVSLYDLLQRVDLVLSAWSTVLMEASLFGCPIILPRNPVSYYEMMADLVCATREEYGDAISASVQAPWSLDRSVRTFRWFWLLQFGSNISLESQKLRKGKVKEYFQNGYKGGLKELRNRRICFAGQQALTQCLVENSNPVQNFESLQALQRHYREAAFGNPTSEERGAVLEQITSLLALINPGEEGVESYPLGRIRRMIASPSI